MIKFIAGVLVVTVVTIKRAIEAEQTTRENSLAISDLSEKMTTLINELNAKISSLKKDSDEKLLAGINYIDGRITSIDYGPHPLLPPNSPPHY